MATVHSPHHLARGAVTIPLPSYEKHLLMGRQENTLKQSNLLTSLLDQNFDSVDTSPCKLIEDLVATELLLAGLTIRSVVKAVMKYKMLPLHNELDARIAQVTRESFIAMMEGFEYGNNLAFVQKALKRATREVLMLMVEDEKVKVAFVAAVF